MKSKLHCPFKGTKIEMHKIITIDICIYSQKSSPITKFPLRSERAKIKKIRKCARSYIKESFSLEQGFFFFFSFTELFSPALDPLHEIYIYILYFLSNPFPKITIVSFKHP